MTIVSPLVGIVTGRVDDPAIRATTRLQAFAFAAYGAGAILAGLLQLADFVLLAWLPLVAVLMVLGTVKKRSG